MFEYFIQRIHAIYETIETSFYRHTVNFLTDKLKINVIPDFLLNESANTKHCTDSEVIFSKLDILELLDRENVLSNLSTAIIKHT